MNITKIKEIIPDNPITITASLVLLVIALGFAGSVVEDYQKETTYGGRTFSEINRELGEMERQRLDEERRDSSRYDRMRNDFERNQ